MGIFQFFKKEKQTTLVPEQKQDQEQEQVMTYIYHEDQLPKQVKKNWKDGLPTEYSIRKVLLTGWNKFDGDVVKKGETLFNIQIQEKFESPIYVSVNAEVDGLLEILKTTSNDLIVRTDYNNYLIEGEKVFRIYKEPFEQKLLELKIRRFKNIPLIKTDKFSGLKEIKWERVAGQKNYGYTSSGFCDNFKFFSDDNNKDKLIFTFNNIENKDFIVFKYPTKDYKLNVGSKISFYFSNSDVHQFEITNKPYKHSVDSNWGQVFETRVQLTIEELESLKTKELSGWKIEFPQTDKKITGIIDSSDIQFSINKLAKEYCELVQDELTNYQPLQNRLIENTIETTSIIEYSYVYLMVDLTNNYHKIGISNRPMIREKTLQSEKPTIEMLCSKRFPNRRIANSFELALHQAYKDKRVRGEWFDLSDKDIQDLKESFE